MQVERDETRVRRRRRAGTEVGPFGDAGRVKRVGSALSSKVKESGRGVSG